MNSLGDALVGEAHRLGFSLVGIAGPSPSDHIDFYRGWVASGYHGEMAYLGRDSAVERRADLKSTLAGVRSVVVVAHEYAQPDGVSGDPARAVIARYARGDDYHDVVKKKLVALGTWVEDHAEGAVAARAYVDTGPILERELAQRAGLGWFGKNTMLINPRRGSYFFIGVLLLDVDLPSNEPFVEDRCGTCRSCLDACPTGALLGRDDSGAPVIDARRCISYLTIELRGSIPTELRPLIGNRVFGCDICQEVCPWNERFAEIASEEAYSARQELDGPTLVDLADALLGMDDEAFRAAFRKSPVKRAGRGGLLRNVCVALGNWGDPRGVAVLERALEDPDALVREHAAWALASSGRE